MRGEALFDHSVFNDPQSTVLYYQFMATLYQKILGVKSTSVTHKLFQTLRNTGRLTRCYTQNIDAFEARDGLCLTLESKNVPPSPRSNHNDGPPEGEEPRFNPDCNVVQLHGTLGSLRCTICHTVCDWSDEATRVFLSGTAPGCARCMQASERRRELGKRALTIGTLRPNVLLYGDHHPDEILLQKFIEADLASNPEVLLIMGTSLKVSGIRKLVKDFAQVVHQRANGRVIFVNRTRPALSVWGHIIDDFVMMDCDDWVKDLQNRRSDLLPTDVNSTPSSTSLIATGLGLVATSQQEGEEDRAWLEAFCD